MNTMPCRTCTAECCGPVALSQHLLDAIEAHLAELPPEEYAALAAQKRMPFDCALIDKRTHTCAVYAVRPGVCRVYGTTEHLKCPHADYSLVQLLPYNTARLIADIDGEPVLLSHAFKYKNRQVPE